MIFQEPMASFAPAIKDWCANGRAITFTQTN